MSRLSYNVVTAVGKIMFSPRRKKMSPKTEQRGPVKKEEVFERALEIAKKFRAMSAEIKPEKIRRTVIVELGDKPYEDETLAKIGITTLRIADETLVKIGISTLRIDVELLKAEAELHEEGSAAGREYLKSITSAVGRALKASLIYLLSHELPGQDESVEIDLPEELALPGKREWVLITRVGESAINLYIGPES